MNNNNKRTEEDSKPSIFIYGTIFSFIVLLHWLRNQFQVPNMDEIWNYQFARRILYGQIPYRDFLMLNLPLPNQVNAFILSLFSDQLIVMRWGAAVIAALNGVAAMGILRIIGKGWLSSSFYTILFISPMLLNPQNNYSWYAVLFLSFALLFEVVKLVRRPINSHVFDFIIGVFLGAVTISKQHIGVAGLTAAIIYSVYEYGTSQNDMDMRKENLWRSALIKFAGWITIVLAELIWLQSNGGFLPYVKIYHNLSTFASYGIGHILYWYQSSYATMSFSAVLIIILATFLCAFNRNNSLHKKQLFILLALYSSANFVMVYPIPDPTHIWFGMPLSILALAVTSKTITSKGILLKGMVYGLLSVLCLLLVVPQKDLRKFDSYELKHYERIPLPEALYQGTVAINDYILELEQDGRNVFYLNYQAPRFFIPLDKFGDRYDTLLTCDLGSEGESDIIRTISTTNDVVAIIAGSNSEKHRRFESQAIQEYVRNNMKYTDHLYGFDVFTK